MLGLIVRLAPVWLCSTWLPDSLTRIFFFLLFVKPLAVLSSRLCAPYNLFCLLLIREEHNDILAVADWGQKLSFYQLSGKQVCSTMRTQLPMSAVAHSDSVLLRLYY